MLVMSKGDREDRQPDLLDVVALLQPREDVGLARGQVGTIVEQIDPATALVEFSDEDGRAYSIVPCRYADLLALRCVPEAA